MTDLLFLAVLCGFFVLAALLVAGCDRIIGPDPEPPDIPSAGELEHRLEHEHEHVTSLAGASSATGREGVPA